MIVVPFVLFLCAALTLAIGVASQGRGPAPGVRRFVLLMPAVAAWCLTSALHGLAGSLETKILWAKVQYLAINAVPPLWLLFTGEYARSSIVASRRLRQAIWVIPAITVLAAATNEWHHTVWTDISLTGTGLAVYRHGWWFFASTAYSYVLLLIGTVLLARAVRRSPRVFRGQLAALIAASVAPWLGNLVYIVGLMPPGVDPTPIGFAASGVLFAWGLYSNHLFDLVPVARDMVVDSLNEAVLVVDPLRRVLDLNAAARRLVGWPDSSLGQTLDALLPVLDALPLAPTTDAPREVVMPDADLAPRYFEVRVMPVTARSGRFAAWAIVLTNVTERRLAAAERDAFQARAQEQQRRESLSLLAGGLAHDFNNLLAGIVGNADLLAIKIAPSSELGSCVTAIQLGAQRAADLVAKMLAYAGERHGSTGRVDLNELVHELLDLLRASAARHCTLDYEGEPVMIDGDATQLRQVAMNLIINAAEAVDEGSGVVTVKVGSGLLAPRQLAEMQFGQDAVPGRYAFLEVRDNGHGMDEQTQRRIFNPFFTTKPDGHGLGLAAVQGIVRGHRGVMHVESAPGRGSRFVVWFPVASARGVGDGPVVTLREAV